MEARQAIKPDTMSINDLVVDLRRGKYQVPQFQRGLVWPRKKIRRLLESIYREYPIGSFFFWEPPIGQALHFKSPSELELPESRRDQETKLILDGQQRIISIYATYYGLAIKNTDYANICVDLEAAKTFNGGEGDGLELFIEARPDGERFISAMDMMQQKLETFRNLTEDYQKVFMDAAVRFQRYPLSVVYVRDKPLHEAVEIFNRINQGGVKLSRLDLIAAKLWDPSFDLRERIRTVNQRFERGGFGPVPGTIFTQALALLVKKGATASQELSLRTKDAESNWDRLRISLELAVEYVSTNLGVKRIEYLPYAAQLVLLTYFFSRLKRASTTLRQKKAISQWFWRSTLTERYGRSAPARIGEDRKHIEDLGSGKGVDYPHLPVINRDRIRKARMTQTRSALRNAVVCMLALQRPLHFKNNDEVNLMDNHFSRLKSAEKHHIFPKALLRRLGKSSWSVHSLPNFAFIPAELNREIRDKRPSKYFVRYRDKNALFEDTMRSHLIPVDVEFGIWNDDFDRLMETRSQSFVEGLSRLCEVSRPTHIP